MWLAGEAGVALLNAHPAAHGWEPSGKRREVAVSDAFSNPLA